MTKLAHPKSGYNELWRSSAYDSEQSLKAIFRNPRSHTGKGYRSADDNKAKNKSQEAIVTAFESLTTHSSSLPFLFLGTDQWFVDTCGDAIKNHCVTITSDTLIEDPSKAQISNVLQKYCGVITTDDWFDVDMEYQLIANNIFRVLKDMYNSGGPVVIAATMGIFSVPQQISNMFEFDSPWTFNSYTRKEVTTTPVGKEILGKAFSKNHVYTKAHFIGAPKEDCLFEEYIRAEDYEDDSDYDEIPSPAEESPIVRHCSPSGSGVVFYFGFVNSLDVSYGDIFLKLMNVNE